MATELAQLGLEVDSQGFVRATDRMKEYERQGKRVETATERMERRMERLGTATRKAGRAIGRSMKVAGAALLAVGANSVRMATTFESELTKMNTLVGVSRAEIDDFREGILQLAPAVGRAPAELARAMFAITSAGNRGARAMELLEAASKASAIGLGDTRSIALAAGAAVTAYGEANLNAAEAVDIMVGTIEAGNLEASQLAPVLGRVLGLTAQAGVSFRDAGAFIAAFTRQGVDAAQAVTGLRGAIQILVRRPTAQAIEAFEKMDMTIEGFRRQVREEGFIDAFQELVDNAREAGIQMGDIIPEMEGLTGVMAVFASEGESAASIADSVGAAVGTLGDRLDAAMENDPALGFAMIRAEFEAMSVRLGSDLLPVVATFIDELNGADGQADLLNETLADLVDLFLRITEHAILAAGMVNELGIRMGQVAAQGAVVGQSMTENFDLSDLIIPFKGLNSAWDTWVDSVDGGREILKAANEDIQASRERFGDLAMSIRAAREENDRRNRVVEETTETEEDAAQAVEKHGETLTELSDAQRAAVQSTTDWKSRIDDLRAELDGPLAQAQQTYISNVREVVQAVKNEEISHEDAAIAVALYRDQLNQTTDEIRAEFVESVDEAVDMVIELTRAMVGLTGESANLSGIGGMLSSIGSGFAQSIFQGQGIRSSISSAFLGIGGQELTRGIEESIQTATEDGLSAAFKSDGFLKDAAAGFSVAIGQAVEGNLGQAALTAAGSAIGAAFGGKAGAQIGSFIGSILGDLFFGDSVPKFQARGTRARRATDAGTDLVLDTDFGDFELAFRELTDEQERAVEEAYTSFFNFLGDLTVNLSAEQQRRVADAVQEFGISSRSGPDSPEGQMKLLLEDVVATFPPFFADLVEAEATLDERLAKFADLLALEDVVGTGRGLAGLGFEDTAVLLDELAMAGESLNQALGRIKTSFDALTRLGQLTGNALRDSTEGLARLGSDLTRLFGGDASAIAQRFDRIFETFFSDEQNLEAEIESAGALGERLLRDLLAGIEGVDFAEEFLTRSGFAELLERLTAMDLDESQLAILSEAGVAIADLIEAEEALAEARGESSEAARDVARVTEILDQLRTDEARRGLEGVDLALFELGRDHDQVVADLEAAGATAEELAEAERLLALERQAVVQEFARRAIEAERQRAREVESFLFDVGQQALQVLSPARAEFAQLEQRIAENARRAQELNLSEEQLQIVRLSAQAQIQGFIASLAQSIPTLRDQFLGTTDAADDLGTSVGRAVRNTRDAWLRSIDQIQAALDGQLTGENTSLTNRERLVEAERQLTEAIAAANEGDLNAMQRVPQLFQQAIGLGAGFFGTSTDAFKELEERLRAMTEGVTTSVTIPPEQQTAQNTRTIANRSREIEQTAMEQLQIAIQLTDQIAMLADLTGRTPAEVGEEFDVPMRDLIRALTGQVPDLTGEALEDYFNDVVNETAAQLDEFQRIEAANWATAGAVEESNRLLDLIWETLTNVPSIDGVVTDPPGTGPTPMPGPPGDDKYGSGPGPNDPVVTSSGSEPVVVHSTATASSGNTSDLAVLDEVREEIARLRNDYRRGTETMVAPLEQLLETERNRLSLERSRSIRRT